MNGQFNSQVALAFMAVGASVPSASAQSPAGNIEIPYTWSSANSEPYALDQLTSHSVDDSTPARSNRPRLGQTRAVSSQEILICLPQNAVLAR